MKKIAVFIALGLMLAPQVVSAQMASSDEQIASAVLGLPESMRADATIIGWDDNGGNVTLREGTNEMVCLADRPGGNFSSACYHSSLAPYMARGRDLTREGITGHDNLQKRWEEIETGTLSYADASALLFVFSAQSFDAATGTAEGAYTRTVLYYPYATPESSGIPADRLGAGMPWLMYPGTVGAHVMINPARGN